MDKTTRTFIAIELNEEVLGALKEVQEYLKKLDVDVRWVNYKNIHLTLKFLGNLSPKKLKSVIEVFPSLFEDFQPFEINITRLGVFPTLQQPRVIWAGVEKNADCLIAIATQVEKGLCRLGFPKEKRGFSPHVTVGRVRSPKNQILLPQALKEYILPVELTQTIHQIILFKSTLTSQGPIYDPLSLAQLEPK